MKNLYYLSIIVISMFGCNNDSNIEGHWHLKPEFTDFEYHTLDIMNHNDTLIHSEKYTFDSHEIRHEPLEKEIIYGGCGGFFSYTASSLPFTYIMFNVMVTILERNIN